MKLQVVNLETDFKDSLASAVNREMSLKGYVYKSLTELEMGSWTKLDRWRGRFSDALYIGMNNGESSYTS